MNDPEFHEVKQINGSDKTKVSVSIALNDSEIIDKVTQLVADLKRMSFKPSCLDLGWGWKVELGSKQNNGERFFIIYSGFIRPDTHTGKVGRGWGRPWTVRINYTDKELFMTCWLAIRQIVEHELLEAFSVDGCRIFDPHKSMADLMFPEVPKMVNEYKEHVLSSANDEQHSDECLCPKCLNEIEESTWEGMEHLRD